MAGQERDDLFTLIHKALRAGVLSLDIAAGRIDWRDAGEVEGFRRRWDQVATLVRSHAGHEERHVWPLLERKQPGSVAELGVGHDPIDAELDATEKLLGEVVAEATPAAGLTFYRALNRLVQHLLEHFGAEEPAAIELLWALCTDAEIAACRAALMADIPTEEAAWTFDLMLQATTVEELRPVVGSLRASMPEPVFAQWLRGVERTVAPDSLRRLERVLAEPVHAG